MKKVLVLLVGALMLATAAMATEIPQVATQAPAYNCDYQPSCEVAPGIYGQMASPVMSKFNLTIGGFVRLDYAYNSQNLGAAGFVLPGKPGGGVNAERSLAYNQAQSEMTARISRFWLKVAGPTFLGAKTGALIEADFMGGNASNNEEGNLRMRHAYGTLDWANTQVLFGQFWDTFGPAAASTIDFRQGSTFGTPNSPRVAQLRLTQKVNFNADNFLKLVLSVQNPAADQQGTNAGNVPNVAGQLMFVSKALGVAPGFYGMSMNSLQAGFFGLWGSENAGALRNVDVYGYGAYAFVPLLKSKDGKSRAMTASLEAQAYISAGMNWNGANASTGLVATATAPATSATGANLTARNSAAKGYGAYGQIIFYPIQDLGFTAGYERRNAINYGSFTNAVGNTYEQYNELIYASASYDLNAAVRISGEYLHARTQYGNSPFAGQGKFGQLNGTRVAAYYFF
jgi:hypothetical protein